MGPGKILDIGCAEASRRVVDMNGAFEAKLGGRVRETGGRDMIAKDVLRPGQLGRLGRDFQLGFEHLLVVVVARTQHQAVLAERDRLLIVIGCDVPEGENRHCGPHNDSRSNYVHFSGQNGARPYLHRRCFHRRERQ